MPPETEELELTGEGVERKAVKSIDAAYRAWAPVKDERCALQTKEKPLRAKLLEKIHENEGDLAKDESGAILYRTSDDKILRLKPGKDKLIIEDAEDDE